MVDEEVNDIAPPIKLPKKPVPLPRKSLNKSNTTDKENNDNDIKTRRKSDTKYFIRGDWKTASEIMYEKSKLMRNEVQKLEKSVRNIITKRRSVHPKPSPKIDGKDYIRSSSLPDDNIFCSISFNSPLEESDTSSDDGSFYTTSELPPPYPPPGLPDESTYDEVTSVTSSDGQCSYFPSSDSNSIYEDLCKFQTGSRPLSKNSDSDGSDVIQKLVKSDSWSFYDAAEGVENRYEIIHENGVDEPDCFDTNRKIFPNEVLIPETYKNETRDSPERNVKQRSSLVSQFDPLHEDQSDLLTEISETFKSLLSKDNSDSSSVTSETSLGITNPFQNPVILSSLSEENSSDEDNPNAIYGKVRKVPKFAPDVRESLREDLKNYDVELPPPSAPPPVPPRRIDSIEEPEKPKPGINRWSSMKKKARMVVENIENRASWMSSSSQNKKGEKVQSEENNKSSTDGQSGNSSFYGNLPNSEEVYIPATLNHIGMLYRPGGVQRWCVLAQRKLTLFVNKDSPDVKETIPVDGILSLRAIQENKISVEGVQVYCFEVSIQSRPQPCLFGAPSASERHVWMRKLLESFTPSFPVKLSLDYTKAGWCYAKEGISSDWTICALLLHHRNLYLSPRNGLLNAADLRKARYLTLQESDLTCKKTSEKGPLLLIDLQDKTLYLQMDVVRETKAWENVIVGAALANGPSLSEQQLTKDGIPTIVDKCINFVHTHGSVSEGIYRRNGSNSTVTKLLASFRRDAWSIQLTRENFNEYDVSSVLKRFFRDLPEPLFVPELHGELRQIIETSSDLQDKLNKYNEVLKKLPEINHITARRLIGHLYFIDKQKDKNLMTVDNLAAIWGPTLMQVQEGTSLDPNWSKVESAVINDLITHYPKLFEVDQTELEREMKILEVLESYHKKINQVTLANVSKPSGDLKIWIYLNSKENGECINITVGPQKTSGEICNELSDKMKEPGYRLCLEEVICNNSMFRPLHHTERILDVVLRWSYWDETDRKDNCLVLRKNDVFQAVAPLAKPPILVGGEYKFADQKSKSFKTYQFQFTCAKLCYYKDKSCSVKIGEWKIEDIIWYIGHEPKRNPHTGWSITFLEKDYKGPRCKEKPFFGNTICGATEEQKLKLMAAMLAGEYAQDILPIPNLI